MSEKVAKMEALDFAIAVLKDHEKTLDRQICQIEQLIDRLNRHSLKAEAHEKLVKITYLLENDYSNVHPDSPNFLLRVFLEGMKASLESLLKLHVRKVVIKGSDKMLDSWYCHKCRDELKHRFPKSWWLLKQPIYSMKELKEDPEKKGFFLCEKHR